ncbi:hypothetical protein L3Q82_017881, partial [Scortum barcoo]
ATSHHTLSLSLSLPLSLPSVWSLLSHSLRRLLTGCQFICCGRATTGFFQPWEQRGKGKNGGKSERRKSGGGQEGEEEEKRRSFVKHPSLLSSLAAAASAPLPPPLLLLLDPLSPPGICLLLLLRELFLELGGGGRSSPPSLPRTLCKASGRKKEGRGGNFRRGHQESRGEATPWFTGEQRREEEKRVRGHRGTQSGPVVAISLRPGWAEQDQRGRQGNRKSPLYEDIRTTGAVFPGCGPEEPLMEPCLTLQRGVFNQCDYPTFSSVCVCLPLEPEGGLLMAAAMAMVVMVVVMMMRWQWCRSRGFWLSSPCLLKDSLR